MIGVQLKPWFGGVVKLLIPDISNLLLIGKKGFPNDITSGNSNTSLVLDEAYSSKLSCLKPLTSIIVSLIISGQSLILNGPNYRSGGLLRRDVDYFIIFHKV